MIVTIDLDRPSIIKILKVYHNLRYMSGREPVFRISSSGRGVHFKVDVDCSLEDAFELRDIIGDDWNRLDMDVARYRVSRTNPTSVLWTEKKGRVSGDWLRSYSKLESIIGCFCQNSHLTQNAMFK